MSCCEKKNGNDRRPAIGLTSADIWLADFAGAHFVLGYTLIRRAART